MNELHAPTIRTKPDEEFWFLWGLSGEIVGKLAAPHIAFILLED
jgi:hypothetical protein